MADKVEVPPPPQRPRSADPDEPKAGWRAWWQAKRKERRRKAAERAYRFRGRDGREGGELPPIFTGVGGDGGGGRVGGGGV